MVKKIKSPNRRFQKVPAIPLPFPPNPNPSHEEVMVGANTVLMLVQTLFAGNPAPVISALKAAEHAFIKALEKEGVMPEKDVENYEVLGIQLAAILLQKVEEEQKKQESSLITPNSSLVGPDGRPVMSMPSADKARQELRGQPEKTVLDDDRAEADTQEGSPIILKS